MADERTRATIDDVAERAGVSIKTVSRVLNNESSVRAETRERVMNSAKALNYRPNVAARTLAGARSYLIGMLYDSATANYVSEIQAGALAECRKRGYHLLVEQCPIEDPTALSNLDSLVGYSRLDGIILTPPVCDNAPTLELLRKHAVPYVSIAPERKRDIAPYVYIDDFRAAYQLTTILIELGHRKIAIIKGHPDHSSAHLRFKGYLSALDAHGIAPNKTYMRQGRYTYVSGIRCAEQLLALADRPTAIFAANDDMAAAAITVAHKRGLTVPGDLSVAGFDDTPMAQFLWPQLTTVRQPVAEMASAAAELLFHVLGKRGADGEGAPAHRLLDFQIIMRDSTAPPRSPGRG